MLHPSEERGDQNQSFRIDSLSALPEEHIRSRYSPYSPGKMSANRSTMCSSCGHILVDVHGEDKADACLDMILPLIGSSTLELSIMAKDCNFAWTAANTHTEPTFVSMFASLRNTI
jgi:hypothetical protein